MFLTRGTVEQEKLFLGLVALIFDVLIEKFCKKMKKSWMLLHPGLCLQFEMNYMRIL